MSVDPAEQETAAEQIWAYGWEDGVHGRRQWTAGSFENADHAATYAKAYALGAAERTGEPVAGEPVDTYVGRHRAPEPQRDTEPGRWSLTALFRRGEPA